MNNNSRAFDSHNPGDPSGPIQNGHPSNPRENISHALGQQGPVGPDAKRPRDYSDEHDTGEHAYPGFEWSLASFDEAVDWTFNEVSSEATRRPTMPSKEKFVNALLRDVGSMAAAHNRKKKKPKSSGSSARGHFPIEGDFVMSTCRWGRLTIHTISRRDDDCPPKETGSGEDPSHERNQ